MNSSSRLISLLALLFASILALISLQNQEKSSTGASNPKAGLVTAQVLPRELEPELSAQAFLVKIIGRGQPLLKRREWKPLPPASLTKLLTVLLAQKNLSQNAVLTISKTAKLVGEKQSSAKEGESFLLAQIIPLALLSSSNDAAMALAEEMGAKLGGRDPAEQQELFLEVMNIQAQAIGMEDSQFTNPTGLDAEGHRTSAQDLARLAEFIWVRQPNIWELSRQTVQEVISLQGTIYTAQSTNELLKEFPAILGGKTGFTDNAKGTLLMLYPLKTGEVAVIVILGSEDRFADGRKIIQWLENYGS